MKKRYEQSDEDKDDSCFSEEEKLQIPGDANTGTQLKQKFIASLEEAGVHPAFQKRILDNINNTFEDPDKIRANFQIWQAEEQDKANPTIITDADRDEVVFSMDEPTEEEKEKANLRKNEESFAAFVLNVKDKQAWTDYQKAEAQKKVGYYNESIENGQNLTINEQLPRNNNLRALYEKETNETLEKNQQLDHKIDRQFGGTDDLENLGPLDASVNASVGSQVQNQLDHFPNKGVGWIIAGVNHVTDTSDSDNLVATTNDNVIDNDTTIPTEEDEG
ncbi:hypothetical protein [Candidatus Chlorohelix sp.]|uniref:hypothetical protein n=1 Tax=Candidatus Chlorohelix sp. TaxID=3139201 RepID=UPI003061481F